ncbi:MAG TPA: response regulator transcription factor [Candidatus Mediterraneibacter pullicola]|uniref:Stage 0 sporulation protein A homolog n=1 Tax=Candidatus Mediterraneibacter pullicola TaxID=2838682 RepID=A0A9D2KJW8_9FIRM|nr:response regulator transcription factor [Candidatus Mediterraneibacter pullicola]
MDSKKTQRTAAGKSAEGTILVVDDNREIVYSISELLKYEGYDVVKAYDGMQALDAMEEHDIDLILLDVMMPRLNGLSALMKLREKSRIPVIILSAKTEESDKVSGLVLGADDYVEKPYNPAELMARVKAHLRRYRAWGGETPKGEEDQIVNGGLILDKRQRVVIVEGEEVRLTATEYKILELLMEHPGQVFSSEQIYENVWQESADYTVENTVMVHIRHIREKIEIDTKKPRYVKVVWGIGYKMEKYNS